MNDNVAETVVITGAGSGFGRALALAWAKRGWKVGVVDMDKEGAEETLGMIEQTGGVGETYRCDVRNINDVKAMADHFFGVWGEVGVLVNNAGVYVVGRVEEVTLEGWARVLDVNLWGIIYGCRIFVPRMKKQGGGHIVNTGSVAGVANLPEMSPYNISKAGVASISETLRTELATYGIGTTVVCTSYFQSDLASTMTTTDDFGSEFANTCFNSSRMSADKIAEKTVQAVEKNKLYVMPQLHVKLLLLVKRFAPQVWYFVVRKLFGTDRNKRFTLWLARRGFF